MLNMTMMRRSAVGAVVGTVLALAGCSDLTVPNLNNPSVEGLRENPTRSSVAAATQGLLRTTRNNVAEMVQWMGAFGREGYPMSQTGASTTGSVQNPLNGANFPGNTLWDAPYRNIRDANLVLNAVPNTPGLSSEEKEATLGFVKTVQAYSFLNVIVTRDRFGGPIDVDRDPTGELAPFESKEAVYDHIATLLDEGMSHLQSGGSSFPFRVHSGLTNFSTPAQFLALNRALRARVAVYRDNWEAALTALSNSFLDKSRPLDYGAYHVFSTVSGDQTNPLNRPGYLYAHTRLVEEAQEQPNGEIDARAQRKLKETDPLTVSGITVRYNFAMYDEPTAPLPWVKNEELILLRAEANIGLGNLEAAEQDINYIRETSGGLAPIDTLADRSVEEIRTELLYNKRYSLVWEYGHVWIDMRHYGRLEQIPTTPADPYVSDAMPIPETECTQRDPRPEGCGQVEPVKP